MFGNGHYMVRAPFLRKDTGVGSLISSVLSSAGVRPCGGCERRAEALDNWLLLKGGNGEAAVEEKVEQGWY